MKLRTFSLIILLYLITACAPSPTPTPTAEPPTGTPQPSSTATETVMPTVAVTSTATATATTEPTLTETQVPTPDVFKPPVLVDIPDGTRMLTEEEFEAIWKVGFGSFLFHRYNSLMVPYTLGTLPKDLSDMLDTAFLDTFEECNVRFEFGKAEDGSATVISRGSHLCEYLGSYDFWMELVRVAHDANGLCVLLQLGVDSGYGSIADIDDYYEYLHEWIGDPEGTMYCSNFDPNSEDYRIVTRTLGISVEGEE